MRPSCILRRAKPFASPSQLLGLSHPLNKRKDTPTSQEQKEFLDSHFASYPLSLIFAAEQVGFPNALNNLYGQLRSSEPIPVIAHETHTNVIDPVMNKTLFDTFRRTYPQISLEDTVKIVIVSLTSRGMYVSERITAMQDSMGMKLVASLLSPQRYPFLKNATKEEGMVRNNLNNVGKRGLVKVSSMDNGALLLTKK